MVPQWDVQQWRWGLEFLAACNAHTSRATSAQLLALAARSRVAFDTLRAREDLACDFSSTGKLVIYRDAASLEGAAKQMDYQRLLGSAQELVSAQCCVDIEPALHTEQARIVGAIYTPSECAADCQMVCDGLHRLLKKRGVAFALGTKIEGFLIAKDRVNAVRTSTGLIEADHFVLALGSASDAVAGLLGLKLPIYPIKGYSITVQACAAAGAAPRVSVTDAAHNNPQIATLNHWFSSSK